MKNHFICLYVETIFGLITEVASHEIMPKSLLGSTRNNVGSNGLEIYILSPTTYRGEMACLMMMMNE